MSRAEITLPSLILASVAGLLAAGYFVFEYSWTTFVFPFGVGVALCALCALQMAAILSHRRASAPAATDEAFTPLSLASLGWMFVLALFLYGLGFVAGPAAYLLVCLRANGSSWRLAVAVALASVLITWGLFIKMMGILLPMKPLWLA